MKKNDFHPGLYQIIFVLLALSQFLLQVNADPAPSPSAYEAERNRMVEEQLMTPGRDIKNPRVLEAMRTVPRHELVPEELKSRAYNDGPLPIGFGQTISQPFIVAFMTEQIDPAPGMKVLEIGTGSGYQAAILAHLGAQVYSIEIIPELAERAEKDLKRLGYSVMIKAGDGYRGWPEHAPFDRIIVTCAPDHVPQPLVEQLKDGGKMIIPVGEAYEQLYLLEKHGGELRQRAVLPVRFVPMTGEAQER